jgi:hypothetical protein
VNLFFFFFFQTPTKLEFLKLTKLGFLKLPAAFCFYRPEGVAAGIAQVLWFTYFPVFKDVFLSK